MVDNTRRKCIETDGILELTLKLFCRCAREKGGEADTAVLASRSPSKRRHNHPYSSESEGGRGGCLSHVFEAQANEGSCYNSITTDGDALERIRLLALDSHPVVTRI